MRVNEGRSDYTINRAGSTTGVALHLSSNTVTTYRGRVLDKLGLKSNAALTRYVIENKLMS